MDGGLSPCGVSCPACEHYPHDCAGCRNIKGRAFWLEYTGEAVCPIYDCCIVSQQRVHCGQCGSLPCERYEGGDPTRSAEENNRILHDQLAALAKMAAEV